MTQTAKNPKLNELEERLKRALADYQNLEKRFSQESGNIIKFANATILARVVEIKDNLERAAANIKDDGIDMIIGQIDKLLEDEKVQEIKAKGEDFDPEKMEAEEVAEGEKDKVVEVSQKGYTLGEKVLRRAKVTVGKGK